MNQLTYERQWMKWKTMKLNRVMCLCFFFFFYHSMFLSFICELLFIRIFQCLHQNPIWVHILLFWINVECGEGGVWTQLELFNLKFINFVLYLLAIVLCVVDCYFPFSTNFYILGINFVRMKFFCTQLLEIRVVGQLTVKNFLWI